MTKTQAKELARDFIQDELSMIYYKIADGDEFSEYSQEEIELIEAYVHKECERACKAIKRQYYTQ